MIPQRHDNSDPKLFVQNAEWVPFRARLINYTILACATGIGYFGSQWFPIREPTMFSETALDRIIPFSSGWSWVYQTVYIALPCVALCIDHRRHLMQYFRGYGFMLAVCFAFFWLYPVRTRRPTEIIPSSLDPMHALILSYDGLINCFPSLHVALGLFSILHAIACLGAKGVSQMWPAVSMWVWFALLCYSTVALKQHYVVDIPAGVAVAVLAFCLFNPSYVEQGS
jgi:membrane-associated phospholipid phosphatase